MFDQVPKKEPGLPADIFEGVDKTPAAPAPVMPSAPSMPSTPPPAVPSAPRTVNASDLPPAPVDHGMGAGKIVAIIVITLGVLAASGYFAYTLMVQPSTDDGVVDAVADELETVEDDEDGKGEGEETGDEEVVEEDEEQDDESPASLLDSDGDGLTNAEELDHGTSMTKEDTDGDGLGDREEVEVYETDPKDVDSDGDTYLDGAEVSAGYDPNGPGRLFTVPDDEASGS